MVSFGLIADLCNNIKLIANFVINCIFEHKKNCIFISFSGADQVSKSIHLNFFLHSFKFVLFPLSLSCLVQYVKEIFFSNLTLDSAEPFLTRDKPQLRPPNPPTPTHSLSPRRDSDSLPSPRLAAVSEPRTTADPRPPLKTPAKGGEGVT